MCGQELISILFNLTLVEERESIVGSIRKFRKFINLPTDRSTSAAVIGHKITHKRASENDDICLFLFLLYLLYGAFAKMKKD